jgi:hypothetical protein
MAQPEVSKNIGLYNKLKEQGLYTKSYEEFLTQFSGHERVAALFSALKSDGYYTKTEKEFKSKFFSHLPRTVEEVEVKVAAPKKVSIKDTRQVDAATGLPLKDTSKFHAEADIDHIKNVVISARKHGINPYTALAVNLAETRFADPQNPFMLGNYNSYGDVIDESIKFMSDKQKYAKRLGKTKEADVIQAWNGYGTLRGQGLMYGIDTNKEPIDMNANPIYGKRVIDLRDRVLRKNPEINSLVDQVLSTNPDYEYKLFEQ